MPGRRNSETGTQGLFCPKEIILRSDVTQCILLKRAKVEWFGWEDEKEQHVHMSEQ